MAGAAVDIHMLMKGALRFALAVGVGLRQTQTVQRSGGFEGHRCGVHVARQNMKKKQKTKQGTCAVCRLLHSLAGVAFVFRNLMFRETEQLSRQTDVAYSSLHMFQQLNI